MQVTGRPAGKVAGIGRDDGVLCEMLVQCFGDMAKDNAVIGRFGFPFHDILVQAVQLFDPCFPFRRQVAGARGQHGLDEFMRIAAEAQRGFINPADFLRVRIDMDQRLFGLRGERQRVVLGH